MWAERLQCQISAFLPMLKLRYFLALAACLLSTELLALADDSTNGSAEPVAIASDAIELKVGQQAPAIDTVDANGKRRRLADVKGAVLLTFFPRCFTGNCTFQLASLRDKYQELQKWDVEVWAISTDNADGPQGQRAFKERHNLPFPLLPDMQRTICLAYGATQSKEQMATRMSILVGSDGTVLWIDKQINPRTHGSDVLARLEESQAKAKSK